MFTLKNIFFSALVVSAAFAVSLDHDDHHDDHHHERYDHANDHHKYLEVWGLEHYDHDDIDHDHKIHSHLHANGKKLNDIKDMLAYADARNDVQDAILNKHTSMIADQIDMQAADAVRDAVQDVKLDNAVVQRKSIQDSVDVNGVKLGSVMNNQNSMILNQNMMSKKLKKINHKASHIMDGVSMNAHAIDGLHNKADAQKKRFKAHAADLKALMGDHDKHDDKQDSLIADFADHDARQNDMAAEVMVNQKKINKVKDNQKVTQAMVAKNNDDLMEHDKNVAAFAAEQLNFNDKVDAHMDDEKVQMAIDNAHIDDQKHHMGVEDTHMKMEALHMAEADHYYHRNLKHKKGHSYHGNHGHHGHHGHHGYHRNRRVIRVIDDSPDFIVGDGK